MKKRIFRIEVTMGDCWSRIFWIQANTLGEAFDEAKSVALSQRTSEEKTYEVTKILYLDDGFISNLKEKGE